METLGVVAGILALCGIAGIFVMVVKIGTDTDTPTNYPDNNPLIERLLDQNAEALRALRDVASEAIEATKPVYPTVEPADVEQIAEQELERLDRDWTDAFIRDEGGYEVPPPPEELRDL